MKPFLYVLNKQSGGKNLDEMNDERFTKLVAYFKENNCKYVIVDAKIEDELKEFEGEEKEMMRNEMNAHDSGIDGLIKSGFDLLGLETYLTTGEMETRAWTIKKGSTAPRAAAAIHTDFETKFIRAEVVAYDDLVACGNYAEAKAKGVLRTEGKEYIVKDGDVIEFKI
jgi:ribosome-binding ATPase YchF (GTP1/OBG family)